MITPHDRIVQPALSMLLVIGLMTCASVATVTAQGIPPLLDPHPGSTITTDPVIFSGAHTSADLKHLLRIGSSLGGSDLYSKSLGTGHSATVSGLPSSGPIYVSYWTLNSNGWFVNRVVFTMDVGSGAPRVWNCPAGDTDCLINAITIGNGSGNPEIIQLAAGTYTLTSLDNGSNLLPRIIGDITIEGAGKTATIIRSNLPSPIPFNIPPNKDPDDFNFFPFTLKTFDVDEVGTLELTDLSILKGGQAISNKGTGTVRKVLISDNHLERSLYVGTGIINGATGTMTIEDSTVSNYKNDPVAENSVGGISNSGTMNITGSSIEGNSSSKGGSVSNSGTLTITASTIARNGLDHRGIGGIINFGNLELINSRVQDNFGSVSGLSSSGTANITGSIFTGNVAIEGVRGGAIFNRGHMIISQTVIAFNQAAQGGGIFNTMFFDVPSLTIDNSVIFGNKAINNNGGDGMGGGIMNENNVPLTLLNSIVTHNTPDNCVGCP